MTAPKLAVAVRGRGRHYKHPKTGKLLPSVTNVISVLDKPALPRWASLETAKAAAKLKGSLAGMDDDDIVSTLKSAPWQKADRAADRGTTIHEWLEKSMLGEQTPELSGEALEYEAAAHRWLDDMQPTPVRLEATMFATQYAGTADGIVEIDGQSWLIDFKTSKGLYESAGLQLAALYGCKDIATDDSVEPMVHVDRVAAVRIGTDGVYEMREIDSLAAHLAAFKALLKVWVWKHDVAVYGQTIERLHSDH